jgi:hypothetical protein
VPFHRTREPGIPLQAIAGVDALGPIDLAILQVQLGSAPGLARADALAPRVRFGGAGDGEAAEDQRTHGAEYT